TRGNEESQSNGRRQGGSVPEPGHALHVGGEARESGSTIDEQERTDESRQDPAARSHRSAGAERAAELRFSHGPHLHFHRASASAAGPRSHPPIPSSVPCEFP